MPVKPGDRVTVDYIALLPDGTVFDTSVPEVAEAYGLTAPEDAFDPLEIEVGSGGPFEAFEEGLVGMEVGEEDTAYAEFRDDLLAEYDHEEFRERLDGAEPAEGMTVEAADGTRGTVVAVDDDGVTVDFNHEMAGEELEFKIRVLDVE